jgi:hypothetical protein
MKKTSIEKDAEWLFCRQYEYDDAVRKLSNKHGVSLEHARIVLNHVYEISKPSLMKIIPSL